MANAGLNPRFEFGRAEPTVIVIRIGSFFPFLKFILKSLFKSRFLNLALIHQITHLGLCGAEKPASVLIFKVFLVASCF